MFFKFNEKKILSLLEKFSIQKNFELNLALAEKYRTDYVFNTSALEWNVMTYPEVETLLEWITVWWHKLSDEKQVLNQNNSWTKLLELVKNKKFEINKEAFLILHKEIAKEEALEWWVFRNANVRIWWTKYLPPKFENLENEFEKWIKKISEEKIFSENIILQAISIFLFSALNQFFFDWNKRTWRIMMNWILLKNWLPILNILAKDKLEFNQKMIKFYDTQDANEILEFLIEYYQKNI